MKKVLYLMHIDWDWIKQRPQFIAEELSKQYDLTVVYPISKNKKILTQNPKLLIKDIFGFLRLPHFLRKSSLMNAISSFIVMTQLRFRFKFSSFDFIFITHPDLEEIIPSGFAGKIIYDCMDDHSEFDDADPDIIYIKEGRLCQKSDLTLCSSVSLQSMLVNKYGVIKENTALIYNALSDKFNSAKLSEKDEKNNKVAYLGTISEWIDFSLVIKSLEDNPKLRIDFIGPVTVTVPTHPRLKFLGAVSHDQIHDVMKEYSCYIMPFIVNDLIKSVDPVKLYEYIYFGGPIVTIYYDEIARFSEYVNFYSNSEEFSELMGRVCKDNLNDLKVPCRLKREKFISNNSWSERCSSIIKEMERLV